MARLDQANQAVSGESWGESSCLHRQLITNEECGRIRSGEILKQLTRSDWPKDRVASGSFASGPSLDLFAGGRRCSTKAAAPTAIVALLERPGQDLTTTDDGKEIVLAFRRPGDLLGELSAIDGQPRSASVEAIEPVEPSPSSPRTSEPS